MSEYFNLIQIISGVLSAALVFIGVLLSAKKLNPEKYEVIPVKTTVISTALIILGLLSYAVTKTCTNLTIVTEEDYELWTLYVASLGEVIKMFGFVVFVPVLFRLFKPKGKKKEALEEDIPEEE
jgi:glucose uptake protein GlcU